jgi:hypothetical protein
MNSTLIGKSSSFPNNGTDNNTCFTSKYETQGKSKISNHIQCPMMMQQPVPSLHCSRLAILGFNSHFHEIATDPTLAEKIWHVELVRCYFLIRRKPTQLREPMWYICLKKN